MADYRFRDAEGKVHMFRGPAGLSQADVDLFARNFFAPPEPEFQPAPAPARPPETGLIPSIKRGAMQTGMLLGDILPAMVGRAVGANEYAERQLREAAATQKEIQEKYPAAVASFTDIKGLGDFATYVKEAVGEAIPSILPGLFTGGAATVLSRGAVAAAKEAAEVAARNSIAKGVAKEEAEQLAMQAGIQAARRTALKYQAAGAFAGSAAQNIPDVYQNILEETGKEDLGAALVSGGFNAVLDAILPIQLLRKAKIAGIPEQEIVGAWYKRGAAGLGKGFLTEGATEAVQEMSSAAAEAFVGENSNFFTTKNLIRFIDAGLKGGVGGGVITGAADIAFGRAPTEEQARREGPTPTAEDVAAEEAAIGLRPAPQPEEIAAPPAPVTPPATPTDVPGIAPGALEQIQVGAPPVTEEKPSKAAQLGKAQADLVQMEARGAPESALKTKRKQIERLTNEIAAESQAPATPAITEGATDVAGVVPTVGGTSVQVPEPADTGAAAPGVGEPERVGMVPTGADVGGDTEREIAQPSAVRQLALEEQKAAGWNPDWPFVPADLGNADFRQLIRDDPNLTPEEKRQIFESGYKLGVVPKNEVPTAAPTPAPASASRTEEDLTLEEDPLLDQAIGQLQQGVSVEEFADLNGISMNRAEVLYQEAQDYLDSQGVAYPDIDAAIDEKEAAPAEAPKVTKATKEPKRVTAGGRETRTGRPSIMGGRTVPAYVQRELQKGNSKALLNMLRTAAPNPVHRAIAQFLYKNELFPTVTLVKSLPGNRVAQYNPRTRSIDITERAIQDPGVLLHEYVHDATIKVLNAYLTGGKLTAGQRQGAQHMQYLMQESRPTLERFFPEAYTNLYEFASYGLTNEEFAKALSKIQVPANKSYTKDASLWERFVKAVSELIGFTSKDIEELGVKLGAPYDADKQAFKLTRKQIEEARGSDEAVMRRAGLMPNAMNTEVFSAFMDIVAPPPAAGVDMPSLPATMQAEPIDTSETGRMAQFEKETTIEERGVKKTLKNWMTKRGAIALTTNFQNDRYALKRWEDKVARFGLIDRLTDNLNNVYGQITRSAATGVDIFNTNMKNLTEEVHNSVQAYAELTGVDTRRALSRLHLIFEAKHEPERRRVKYILNVPLNPLGQTIDINELIKDPGLRALFPNATYSPSGFREQVMKILSTPTPGIDDIERAARARELRAALDKVVDNPANHDTTVTTRVDKKGRTVKLEDPFNQNGPDYSVIGARTPEDIALIERKLYSEQDEATRQAIDRAQKAIRDVTDKTIDLNKRANYFSQPTSNVVDFYGFNNYVPFKGRPGATQVDEDLEIGSKRVGGELQEAQDRMEGRLSESENPILQILADGAAASLRLGRKDLTLAIKNAVEQNLIPGKRETITFEDRYLDRVSKQTIGGPDKIFHYNSDGTIDVVQIGNRDLSQAIRRQYRESSPIIDVANNITSFVGMMHTRYNPSFAPMNFVRDILTNAFTLGAELGPTQSVRLINQVAADVASGGMFKTLKFARLYTAGKFDEIRKLAAKDPYYKDIQEYVEQGGKVSYLQGIAAKGALDQLIEEVGARQVGQNKIATLLKKKDIDRFLDIYNDMFELASRVASYRVMRDTMTSKNVERGMSKADAEKDATIQAVEYAKNLANFEQVGKYGKEAGSLFMFFRPAATGAVRAIEALSPAFMKFDEAEFRAEGEKLGATPEQIDRAVKEMQQRKASARRMAMGLTGMGMMIYFMAVMMAGDDDEGRNRVLTDDMARWTRYARFHIPGTDTYFQIPWGFGLGFFASLGAQLGAVLAGRNSIADAFGNSIPTFLDSFLPLPVSRINPFENPGAFVVDSALPSVARPIVEYMMNIDGLGREIYNNRQSRFGDAYTGGDNIPEMYKAAARKVFDMTNGAIDVSPNSLFFFASNYADGFAKVMSNATNLAMTATGYKEPDIRNDVAILASFFGTKSNVDAREFSKVEKEILDMSKRINALKNQPEALDRYLKDHATDYALVQFYNQAVNGTLRQLREAANVIRANPELTPKERKAQVDEIVKLQNFVKRDILNGFEAVGGIKP